MKKVYCDMDGVLVDYCFGIVPFFNSRLRDFLSRHKVDSLVDYLQTEQHHDGNSRARRPWRRAAEALGTRTVVDHADDVLGDRRLRPLLYYLGIADDYDWWFELPPARNAVELWEGLVELTNDRVEILTIPPRAVDDHAARAKNDWCAKHLGLNANRVHVVEDKASFAMSAGDSSVLIDDRKKILNAFQEAGGIGLYYRADDPESTVKKTLAQLKELFGNSMST